MGTVSEIEALLIERICKKLIYEFAEAIDQRNDRHLETLFTEDATYSRPIEPNAVISGREAIVNMFIARPGGRVSRHICSNVRITVDSPTSAHGVSRVMLIAGTSEPAAHPQFGHKADARQLIGEYDETFVKTADGWRFSSRRGRVILHT